ncbi:hypothetical protein HELRODRAFT_71540 [Helobdella robusta]|uniref:Protein FAM76A n=1 Tax=Helobdella robusta TaxID=6412 RepID=T1G0N0_HELRO|nr:hypothetical protein HELRODRAFT_71540 [Helobdella robusta]ESO11692.1 hypothetical protein HELRODRAFT_71540 [Helobdella robusta]
MAALFACTKCHKRHSFEELSTDEQLCQVCVLFDCSLNFILCFHLSFLLSFHIIFFLLFCSDFNLCSSSICKGCSHFSKLHGKPKACDYCKEIAAFVGNKCQRCTHQEKKYGQPKLCERCKNVCAFDRGIEYRKTMEGKLLCWLCIVAYKRMYKKQKKLESSSSKNTSSKCSPFINNNSSTPTMGQFEFDFGSGEHMTTITQLKETIESLKRQLQAKDQVILQKDQKITELKAHQFETEKEMRSKVLQLQKGHDETVENMQVSYSIVLMIILGCLRTCARTHQHFFIDKYLFILTN